MTIEEQSSIGVEIALKKSGALQTGHFILRSGLHSHHYFQCAKLGENPSLLFVAATNAQNRINQVAEKRSMRYDTICGIPMGGLAMSQEIATLPNNSGKRNIFLDKEYSRDNITEEITSSLTLKRFQLREGEKVLLVEDVVTRGGRINESIQAIKEAGGIVAGVVVVVDRSEGKFTLPLEIPLISLYQKSFPTYPADQLPDWLEKIPVQKLGS